MSKIIDGRAIAERVKDEITKEIYSFNGLRPNLAIILIGEREDSKLYVSLKERESKKVGIDTHLYSFESSTSEESIIEAIEFLNKDELVDGILVQLPLPEGMNTDKIISAIDPSKDVDGFHPQHPDYVVSPVFAAVVACLEEIKLAGSDKKACLLYHSDIFGRGLEDIITKRGFTIIKPEETKEADLIVTALGNPLSLKKEAVKKDVVIIDIGIAKVDGHIYGDADFADLQETASFITPVPGGIGPMTIAFLFKNVLEIFRRRHLGEIK